MKTTIHCGDLRGGAENLWNAGMAERIEKVISDYIEAEKPLPEAAQECEISLTFAGEAQMAEINKEYRETEGADRRALLRNVGERRGALSSRRRTGRAFRSAT